MVLSTSREIVDGAGSLLRKQQAGRGILAWTVECIASAESAAALGAFLARVIRGDLVGHRLEVNCVEALALARGSADGRSQGPVQSCLAHTIRNVRDKVMKADRETIGAALSAIKNTRTLPKALSPARRFGDLWEATDRKVVDCLRCDLDEPLTYFRYRTSRSARRCALSTTSSGASARCRRALAPWASPTTGPRWTRILLDVLIQDHRN